MDHGNAEKFLGSGKKAGKARHRRDIRPDSSRPPRFCVHGGTVVWRYNANGTLDTSFNGSGFMVHDNAAGGSGDDGGRALVLDSSGRMVVTGYSTNPAGNRDLAEPPSLAERWASMARRSNVRSEKCGATICSEAKGADLP